MLSPFRGHGPAGPGVLLPDLDFDMALDDLALRAGRDRAVDGDWVAARDVVAAAGTNWELRARRISVLSVDAAEDDGWLQAWLRATPDDPSAVTLLATTLGIRAGDARGGDVASRTSAEQFRAFRELSAQSAEVSRRAMALVRPDDPVPHIEALRAAFATQQVHTPQFQELLAEALRRDPYHFDLHVTNVTLLCEKWFGSHDEMFTAARTVAAAAPPGSGAVMMPFLAHFEYAKREFAWEDPTPAARLACARHFERPDVRHELDTWAAKWRAGRPNPARAMTCRHWLALAYYLSGRRAETRRVLQEIGPYLGSTAVWHYFFRTVEDGYTTAWRYAHDQP